LSGYSFVGADRNVPLECVADKVDLSHRVSLFDIHLKYGEAIPLKEILRYVRSMGGKDHG
jgi:maleamate amidohydrolase